jgi:two-component system, OmpR family, KDP operon response regulator KdpE
MSTVLIVDDDPRTLDVLRIAFTARGYQVVTETTGHAALRTTGRTKPQVILLGTELSDMDGTDALLTLRTMTSAPIIALSTRPAPEEIVRALDTGADDYVIKPFRIEELLARTRAAVRRAAARPGDERLGIVDTGSFTVDLDARKVWRDGAEVHLTPIEWSVLEVLIQHEGRLVTQRELLRTIWGPDHYTDTHYLRVYIGQLRRKLEPEPANPRHLITEPNQGYRFHTHRTDTPPRTEHERDA